jgi:Protein of unknown function (DUF3499)
VEAAPLCSRLGCDQAAVAVFAFDARESLVWLDPISTTGRGAGVLCERHADRLSPPRGWNLLDRRAAEARLWTGRPAAAPTPTTPHAPRRERPARSRPCAPPGPLLPFDTAPFDTAPFDTAPDPMPVASAQDTTPRTWSPHDRPGPEFEHVLDARTPLLARAFDSARPTDAT